MAYLCPHPCDGKTEYGYCHYTWCINPLHSNFGTAYQGQGVQRYIITNADRIRNMKDEELAHTLWLTAKGGIIGQRSEDEWLNWLRREATDV